MKYSKWHDSLFASPKLVRNELLAENGTNIFELMNVNHVHRNDIVFSFDYFNRR
jgi:hypothetical protein